MKQRIDICAYSHTGRRKENQDRVLSKIIQKKSLIAIIVAADGMGGHQKGDIAAEIAINTIIKMTKSSQFHPDRHDNNRNIIRKFIQKANSKIYAYSQNSTHPEEMGTTVTGAVIVGDSFYVFNVGDSRTYGINRDGIHLLTVDHTADQEALEKGIISQSELGRTPYANALVRALGTHNEIKTDIFPPKNNTAFPIDEDIILFCCSDGLWGKVTAGEILTEITGREKIKDSLNNLASLAYLKGSSDNISAAAIELGRMIRTETIKKKYPSIEKLINKQKIKKRRLHRTAVFLSIILVVFLAALGYFIIKEYPSKPKTTGGAIGEAVLKKVVISQKGDRLSWTPYTPTARYTLICFDPSGRQVYKQDKTTISRTFDLKTLKPYLEKGQSYFINIIITADNGKIFGAFDGIGYPINTESLFIDTLREVKDKDDKDTDDKSKKTAETSKPSESQKDKKKNQERNK